MLAKTEDEEEKDEESSRKVGRRPELVSDRGRVRSKEDEEALDKKIAEIRRKNQLIEQRKELVEEDRANFVNEYGEMSLCDGAKGTMCRNKQTLKAKKPGEWDREWDAGKTSVENWKENVPDIDNNKAPNAHFLRRVKNRSNSTRGNNNSTSKKLTEIKEKKQKLEGNKMTVCAETNKITSPTNKKIFDAKNSKNLKNSGSTSNDNDSAVRNTHRMKAMNRLKQSHLSSNEQPNKSYKKSSSGSSKNRYSTRRVASTAATLPLPTAFMQHLDTVKVNVSMLELKKDAVETSDKRNNNIGEVDNSLQELSTIVTRAAAASTTSTRPTVEEEYGINDSDVTVMEDVRKIMEEMLSQMKSIRNN